MLSATMAIRPVAAVRPVAARRGAASAVAPRAARSAVILRSAATDSIITAMKSLTVRAVSHATPRLGTPRHAAPRPRAAAAAACLALLASGLLGLAAAPARRRRAAPHGAHRASDAGCVPRPCASGAVPPIASASCLHWVARVARSATLASPTLLWLRAPRRRTAAAAPCRRAAAVPQPFCPPSLRQLAGWLHMRGVTPRPFSPFFFFSLCASVLTCFACPLSCWRLLSW